MKKTTQKRSATIQWIITVILGLATIGAFSVSIVSGIFFLLGTVIVCPVTRNALINFVTEKVGDELPINKIKGWMYGVVAFVFVCIGSQTMPTTDTINENLNNSPVEVENMLESNEIPADLERNNVIIESSQEFIEVASEESSESSVEIVSDEEEEYRPTIIETEPDSDKISSVESIEKSEHTEATSEESASTIESSVEILREPVVSVENSNTGAYAVNGKNGKIHMVGECSATGNGKNAMKVPVYFNTFEDAEEYSTSVDADLEKRRCGNCW